MEWMDLIKRLKNFFASPAGVAVMEPNSSVRIEKSLTEANVFTAKNIVLIPGTLLPFRAMEDVAQKVMQDSLSKKLPLMMADRAIQPGSVCGLGQVRILGAEAGAAQGIFVEGEGRYVVREIVQKEPFYKVLAEKIEDVPLANEELEKLALAKISESLKKWIFSNPSFDDQFLHFSEKFTRAHQIADFVGNHFLPTAKMKQNFLEEPDVAKRVETVIRFLDEESARLMDVMSRHSFLMIPTESEIQ